jgi:hypothetical protein
LTGTATANAITASGVITANGGVVGNVSGNVTVGAGQTLTVTGATVTGLSASSVSGISGTYAPLASPALTGTATANAITASGVITANGGVVGNVSGNVTVGAGQTLTVTSAGIIGDISNNARLFIASDASLNGRLFVKGDISMNGNLYANYPVSSIPYSAIYGTQVSSNLDISGSLRFLNNGVTSTVTMKIDPSNQNQVDVSGLMAITQGLGIGTMAPQYALDIANNSMGCGRVVQFSNTSSTIAQMPIAGNYSVALFANAGITVAPGQSLTMTGATIVNNGGILTIPSTTDTFVARNTVDILSNKTLAIPTITGLATTAAITASDLITANAGLTVASGQNLTMTGASVIGDLSNSGRLLVKSDASLNGRLFVNGDLSMNGNLVIGKDIIILGNLTVQEATTNAVVNTITTNVFSIGEDLSLNGRIRTSGDASFGGNLYAISSAGPNRINAITANAGTSGNVGIGTTNPQYVLDVNGTVRGTSFSTTSDYRIKKNVTSLSDSYTVDNLHPVAYLNMSSNREDIGFLAHEVQEHYPFLVNGEKDGAEMQSINYIGLIGILVKEIQELKRNQK